MRYYVEDSLSNFNFWSGGKERANNLSAEQLDQVETLMEEIEPAEGWSDTEINDFFWFEFDTIAQHLGYRDEEYFDNDVSDADVDDANDWKEGLDPCLFDDRKMMLYESKLDESDYWGTEDSETEFDLEGFQCDFNNWWEDLTDLEKVEIYRKYN